MANQAEITAKAFAAALDAGDWDGVESLMAPTCRYLIRKQVTDGSAEITASYRRITQWVETCFERVRYESSVEAEDEYVARIHFRDLIDHGPHSLDFRCEQLITVDTEGHIVRIQHVDLPGELEKAAAFNARCGVTRP